PLRRHEPDLAPDVRALRQQLQHHGTDGAGRAHDCQGRLAHRPLPAYTVASSPPPSSNASCTARTAVSRSVSRHTTEIRISDVEMISMLTPAADSASQNVAVTPGCDRIPAPTNEILPTCSSYSSFSN